MQPMKYESHRDSYSSCRQNGWLKMDKIPSFWLFCLTLAGFPLIHSSPLVTKEVINSHSLLYTVQGSDPTLMPYMLAAHQDVVPVKDQDWDYPPFEAREVDGYIYGRGTIDDKHALMVGIFEGMYLICCQ